MDDLKTLLEPPEAWDAAEQQIDAWREDELAKRRAYWRAMNGY